VRLLKFAAGLAAAVVVHALALRLFPEVSLGLDLYVVVVVLHALDGNSLAGLLGGLAAGLVQDSLSGGVFGLYGCADTIVGYAVARTAQRLVIERPSGVLSVTATAAVVQQAIVVGLASLLLPGLSFPELHWLALRAVSAGVVAMLAATLAGWRRGVAAERRQRRRDRLHL
jgi:rod shape-determining protein MreD